jgi:type II secretory pathway component PulF
MRACGPAFTEFQLQLVKVGEHTGSLMDVLAQIADHDERDRALRMRLRASLTYPAALFVACTLMLLVLPPLFLKSQSRMLEVSGVSPPLLTRIVLGTAGFVGSPIGMAILLGLFAGLVLGWRSMWASRAGRLALQGQLLKAPTLGRVLLLVATSRFARSLALQVQVGLNLLMAVPSAAAASDDAVLISRIKRAVDQLREGTDLSQALDAADYFPRGFLVLVKAGEESGHLEETLQWVARLYELELECSLEILCSMLEPIMMGIMGVAAALICLATMLPLVKLVQSL